MQTAQPVTFGHHLLAYVEMTARDRGRFADARKRLNESPLGAAALAGTSFPLDRDMTAKALGFDRPMANSLDAVSDARLCRWRRSCGGCDRGRASVAACGRDRHLDLAAHGLVKLSDKFTTGSSIMPQKRNPDAAELVRAKAGRVIGALSALLIVMKGLPLAYAKDMQEDKEGAMDALAALSLSIAAMTGMVADLEPDTVADEKGGRRGLRDRDRSRRLAGADLEDSVPRGASPYRPDRRQGSRDGFAVASAAACHHAGDRAADWRGRIQRSLRRSLGEEPNELWRYRAEKCAGLRRRNGCASWKRKNPDFALFVCFAIVPPCKERLS